MCTMANPMDALNSYQKNLKDYYASESELDSGYLKLHGPKGHGYTYEFLKIVEGELQALVIFGNEEPINGKPRFSMGYAVAEKHRGQGLVVEAINKGIEELKKEARRASVQSFFC